jgi:hypothetical protein
MGENAMIRPARLILPLLLLSALGACHNDPFSIKPEVRGVKIPEKTAPADADTPDEDAAPAPDSAE